MRIQVLHTIKPDLLGWEGDDIGVHKKTPHKGGVSYYVNIGRSYVIFLRRDRPMKPISAVPNSQAAAGTGTGEISRFRSQ